VYAIEKAMDEALRRCRREIRLEGKLEAGLESVKIALLKGFPVKVVADMTGLDEDFLRKMKADAVI
jgi:hypothetical protein